MAAASLNDSTIPTEGVKLYTAAAVVNVFHRANIFSRPWMQLRAGPSSSEGEHVRAYDIQAAIVPRTTCESDQQPGSTNTRTEGDVVRMCDQVQETTMTVSRLGDIIGAEGDRPILEMRPRGAAPTSPPEGVLRHMLHQELWRAVGTHYEASTSRLGSTGLRPCHRRDGTAGTPGASTAAIAAGPPSRHYQ